MTSDQTSTVSLVVISREDEPLTHLKNTVFPLVAQLIGDADYLQDFDFDPKMSHIPRVVVASPQASVESINTCLEYAKSMGDTQSKENKLSRLISKVSGNVTADFVKANIHSMQTKAGVSIYIVDPKKVESTITNKLGSWQASMVRGGGGVRVQQLTEEEYTEMIRDWEEFRYDPDVGSGVFGSLLSIEAPKGESAGQSIESRGVEAVVMRAGL